MSSVITVDADSGVSGSASAVSATISSASSGVSASSSSSYPRYLRVPDKPDDECAWDHQLQETAMKFRSPWQCQFTKVSDPINIHSNKNNNYSSESSASTSGSSSSSSISSKVNCLPLLAKDYSPSTHVRFVVVSDTHGRHSEVLRFLIGIPFKFDVFLHCGDFSRMGTAAEIEDFCKFLGAVHTKFPHVKSVVIAGNHDLLLDEKEYDSHLYHAFHRAYGKGKQPITPAQAKAALQAAATHYLDESSVFLDGIRIFGSPSSPEFHGWAFNYTRGAPLRRIYKSIPSDTDLLLIHGPPLGILDLCQNGEHAGCADLLAWIKQNETPPKVVCFGHIHEDGGVATDGKTMYINASTCTLSYKAERLPVVFDIAKRKDNAVAKKLDKSHPAAFL